MIEWGNSVRGCPSTFQPDRCVVVEDTNGNGSDEIVFGHPNFPWLLCVDGANGDQLWRTDLLQSAGIQTLDADSLCPIVLQYSGDIEDPALSLSVVVAAHAPALAATNRWIMNVDPATGKVRWKFASQQTSKPVPVTNAWKLPDDCVCSPKLIRTVEGRTLVLTAHAALANATDFVAWDVESNRAVWQQSIECDLNRLPQSYLSRQSDFPIVVDLDGDGGDEWIAPSHVAGTRWSNPMTPPYGMVVAHRGDNGKAIWEEPF